MPSGKIFAFLPAHLLQVILPPGNVWVGFQRRRFLATALLSDILNSDPEITACSGWTGSSKISPKAS